MRVHTIVFLLLQCGFVWTLFTGWRRILRKDNADGYPPAHRVIIVFFTLAFAVEIYWTIRYGWDWWLV